MSARRWVLAIALGVCAMVPAAPAHADPKPKLTDYFSREDIDRAKRYNAPRYALGFGSLALGLVALGVLSLGPTGRAVGGWIPATKWPLQALILAAVVTVVPAALTLPLDLARNLYHERAWALSTQSFGGYASDWGKGLLVGFVITAVAALGFFGIVRLLPRAWPAAAAAFAVALTVVMVIVYPLVYEPLFNKFTPVEVATRDRIIAIAKKAGVKVDKVLVADASKRTRKENAYVSGLGSTKRVVLYDTLLQRSTPDEVDLVVAHELGHVRHNDVVRGTILGSAGAAGAVLLIWFLLSRAPVRTFIGATGPGDPKALPFLAFVLSVASLVTLPVTNAFSRHIEGSADRFAVELTHEKQTAVQVEVNLATRNLSDLTPNRFIQWVFFSHPSTIERIEIAQKYG